jgi:hypothetical protein
MNFNQRSRDWKKFENDEIMTIWKGFIAQEFGTQDPLRMRRNHDKPIRLTPLEIIALVDDLMRRLDIKENGPINEDD